MLKYPIEHVVLVTRDKTGRIGYRIGVRTVDIVVATIHFRQTSKQRIVFDRIETFRPLITHTAADVFEGDVSIARAEQLLRDHLL